jgi:hypothetical protein
MIGMLRFGYLPSDYHPLLLLLGEAEDMRGLAALLRDLAARGTDIALAEHARCATAHTAVLLTTVGARPGLYPVAPGSRSLVWTLVAEQAEYFAELIDELATQTSGSAVLDCGILGEIPVKASIGEYPDDFLRPG